MSDAYVEVIVQAPAIVEFTPSAPPVIGGDAGSIDALKIGPVFSSMSEAKSPAYGKTGQASIISVVSASGALLSYVYDVSSTVLTTGDGRTWAPSVRPSPEHFGAICDGVTDDTAAISAMHSWCNAHNIAPSYDGVTEFAVQANAQIEINTDVDFCGAVLNVVGGIVSVPAWGSETSVFIIRDTETPVQTGTVSVLDANLARGSRTPTADFWTAPGYVYMQGADPLTSPLIVDRPGTSTLTYRQMFKVLKDGVAVHPLARSMVGCGTVYYRARSNSERGWLTISNLVVNASTFNNAVVLMVQRNQTKVSQISITSPSGLPASINAIIKFLDCADGLVEHVTSPAMTSYGGSNGTYLVQTDYAAEITLNNINAMNGWGATATNLTSGMYFNNCRLNRVDIHFMGFNLFVDGCVISENGVVFGCGGGALVVRNSTFIECPVLASRTDYGGYWFGYCDISNVTLQRHSSVNSVALDMETNPVGFTSTGVASLPLFETIRISGVHRAGYTGTSYLAAMRIKVKSGAEGKLSAPISVSIQDVTSAASTGWTFFNTFDLLNMIQTPRVEVSMADINASRQPTTSQFDSGYQLLRLFAKVGSHTTPDILLLANNVSQVAVDLSLHTTAPRIELHACKSIRRVAGGTGGRVIVTGGTLESPVLSGAETKGKLGNSGTSGAFSIVSLLGAEVTGAWDLSLCNHMAANVWSSSQDASITLPAGVTWAIQAAGWRG